MRNRGAGIFILALATRLLHAGAAADMARQIAQNGLDPEDCYRVRDLTLTKEDVRLYFSEGHIIFGKPAGDAPISAVFVTSVQGGDAEILTLPPSKSERQSLASYTGSPNLSEHFKVAAMLFTDETYRELVAQIRDNSSNKKSPEMGLTLAPEWNPVTRNLAASFESRLVLDLLSGPRASRAFSSPRSAAISWVTSTSSTTRERGNRSRLAESGIATPGLFSMFGRRLNRERCATGRAPGLSVSSI